MIQWNNLLEVLKELGNSIKEGYKDRLNSDEINASNSLSDSVQYVIRTEKDGTFEVSISLLGYYYWIENGRKPGKLPPLQPFLDWIEVKKTLPRPDNPRAFAEAIRWNLTSKDNGGGGKRLEGKHPLENTVEQVMAYYDQRISDAITRDILESL